MTDTVLLLDDSEDLLTIYTAMLEHGGFTVIRCTDASAALHYIRVSHPHTVVVDASLCDGRDGWTFIAELRAQVPGEAFAIIVLEDHDSHARIPRNINVSQVLKKPIEPRELLEAVQSIAADARSRAARA